MNTCFTRRVAFALALLLPALPAAGCNVDVAAMSFGGINPLDNADTDSVAVLTITCPTDTAFSAAATAGTGSFAERRMSSGTHTLAYQLYTEASHSMVWGDGTAGTGVISGTAGATGSVSNIFGRVPAQPFAIPGAYTDTLVVTVSY